MASSTRRFAVNAGWLLAGTLLTRAISAVALILIARQLGVERYGQFVASQSITGLTTVVFTLGMEGLVLREGGQDRNRPFRPCNHRRGAPLSFPEVPGDIRIFRLPACRAHGYAERRG